MEEVGITSNSYFLEVSSPGIDRPLLLIEDFERFKGFKVSVKLHCSILEKKNFVIVTLIVS